MLNDRKKAERCKAEIARRRYEAVEVDWSESQDSADSLKLNEQ